MGWWLLSSLWAAVLIWTPAAASEQQRRDPLARTRSLEWVEANLISKDRFYPAPNIKERDAWEGLPPDIRADYISRGEKALAMKWEHLSASVFLDYVRNGNRSNYEAAHFNRRDALRALTIAELIENQGRFIDQIGNGIWATCEESFWGIPTHLTAQKRGPGLPDITEPVVDLFAAETAAQLAWTDYLLGSRLDDFSPLMRTRIAMEIERRVLQPFVSREDFYWMGFGPQHLNNWTPWITSNVLASVLLIEKDPARRAVVVHKSLQILDRFLKEYGADGGCDEGPGYWGRAGGSLFDCLELLHKATDGKIDVFHDSLIKEICRYIYRVHIDQEWYVNFADASAQTGPDGALVYRIGQRIGDKQMMEFGAWLRGRTGRENREKTPLGRVLPEFFEHHDEILSTTANAPQPRDVWFPSTQVMIARDYEGSGKGLFLAAQGGHNAESHNHNDVGNFIVAVDGRPVLIDVGVETYTAKTFDKGRYDIWTMQSAYHNLPTINDAMQAAGRQFAARDVNYRASDKAVEFSLDIAGAYPRGTANKWERRLKFIRGEQIEIRDAYSLPHAQNKILFSFMTACEVKTVSAGKLILAGGPGPAAGNSGATLEYDSSRLQPVIDEIHTDDARLKPVWGDTIRRIQLIAEGAPPDGVFVFRIKPNTR